MGLAGDLGYKHPQQNGMQRLVAWAFATKPGSWLSYRIGFRLDGAVLKLTDGTATFSGLLTAVPTVWVTTTGARSAESRRSPLAGIPVGDDLALIGSGFGQERTPGWVYNLEANPNATVEYQNRSVAVRARAATAAETSEVWDTAADLYPGYAKYRERAAHRTIRVFVLEPLPSSK
jgi:deazaflavin-dependent oxidoreductase (nitroreductase family)